LPGKGVQSPSAYNYLLYVLRTYNKITEKCLLDCIKDFTSNELNQRRCLAQNTAVQKYLKMPQSISMRFQECHIQQNEALEAKAGWLGQ
ncbi:TIM9 translocase, partial [Alcedo cyanopectus]|nr:TIM9 translocase [Ceyx cyanopectus]